MLRRRSKHREKGTCRDHYLLHPLRDRSVPEGGLRRLCAQLGQAIPRCGAELIGYFAPHEGSATTAYGVYAVDSLAEYEAYRARLARDPLGKANYDFARERRFILREDRIFLKLASGPHAERIVP